MVQSAQNRIPGLQVKAEARQRLCLSLPAKLPERLSMLPFSLYLSWHKRRNRPYSREPQCSEYVRATLCTIYVVNSPTLRLKVTGKRNLQCIFFYPCLRQMNNFIYAKKVFSIIPECSYI